ncbi:MAG: MBL fold metallo-hydrolase [Candidatus Zixiibacteriota bacterium]|nr:MAG: MBL fold metallo-hydrolase [candidate division Zixibacteria bacterium]
MRKNDSLRIHVINVGHGDAILVEFPDDVSNERRPRFGLVDAGGEDKKTESKTRDYINTFLEYRFGKKPSTDPKAHDYTFEFICLTHPHGDHLYGMMAVLEHFCGPDIPPAMRPKQFWDCGFRHNQQRYRDILSFLVDHPEVRFMRVASGTEFHYDDTEVLVIAPSIDMRNRYDTFGVDVNDASIVLRITHGDGVVILTGDAHFDTWGKVCEEFPRKSHLTYPKTSKGKLDPRDRNRDGIAFLSQENQLDCHLLKISHHGSKRGTSYEYIEKLSPTWFAISCDQATEYSGNWKHKFPHPITRLIIGEESKVYKASNSRIPSVWALRDRTATTAKLGTLVYKVPSSGRVKLKHLGDKKDEDVSVRDFARNL